MIEPTTACANSNDDGGSLDMSAVLTNIGHEMDRAKSMCVNLEEILADQLLKSGEENSFVRRELQNIDRLNQLITDIGSAAAFLGSVVSDQKIKARDLQGHVRMNDVFVRLSGLSGTPEKGPSRTSNSDMTFF